MYKRMILCAFVCVIMLFFSSKIHSAQLPETMVDVTITAVFADENTEVISAFQSLYGSDITITLPDAPEGQAFLYWIVNGSVRDDLSMHHVFTATHDLNIHAIYYPIGYYAVTFIEPNGILIDVSYYLPNLGVVEATPPSPLPNKPGLMIHSEVPWKNGLGDAIDLSFITDHTVCILNYEIADETLYYMDVTSGDGTGFYPYNTIVTVTADTGPIPFSHWTSDGEIVSYEPVYRFSALFDRELTAVFNESVPEVDGHLSLYDTLSIRSGYQTYISQLELSTSFELLEYGFLIHPTSSIDLNLTTDGVIKAQSNMYHPITHEYMMSFPEGSHLSVRAYAIYQDETDIYVMYSNTCHHYPYEVTFLDYDDTVLDVQMIHHGQNAIAPVEPTRAGYQFDDWDQVYTNITSDTVIRATYHKLYSISFDTQGGSTIATIYQIAGSPVTAPTNPTRTGYDFAGWYHTLNYADMYTFNVMPEADIIIYADWGSPGLSYTLNGDSTGYIVSKGTLTAGTSHVIIPARYQGLPIKEIANSGFQSRPDIVTIRIPESVRRIGSSAFYGCTYLTELNLPSEMDFIGSSMCQNCARLESVVIPDGITTIYQNTFNNAQRLTYVFIPNSVTKIDNYAFYQNYLLETVVMSSNMQYIGLGAFHKNYVLTSIYLPMSVTIIKGGAFAYCDSLTIYAARASEPISGWDSGWNPDPRPIIWNHTP